MKLRIALSAAALLALVACGRPSEDASRVLASVGGQKVTEADFSAQINALIKDPEAAKAFLTDEAAREERMKQLYQMAGNRAVRQLAALEGLDKDLAVQDEIDGAVTKIYFQALMQRRVGHLQPKEGELKAFYDQLAARSKAQGQTDVPPFEKVEARLLGSWRQVKLQEPETQQAIAAVVRKELETKVPMIFAEDYQLPHFGASAQR